VDEPVGWRRPLTATALVALALFLAGWSGAVRAQTQQGEYLQLRGAVHVHSSFSTGRESIEEIARSALAYGVDVLVLADDDLLRVEYGVPFLRRLLRFSREEPALFSQGTLGAYLDEIRRVAALYPQLILIDGIESSPFYYWDVDLGERRWTLHEYDKHILALDLRTEEAYAGLPVLGNERIWVWHWSGLLLLWPLAGLAYFALLRGRHPGPLRWVVLVISVLCLVNNAPFKVPLMDPYSGDLGPAPFQNYIDYVQQRGGMVFWPHPEAKSGIPPQTVLGGLLQVVSLTPPHPEDLVETRGYTGFAALYGDNITITEPGGVWDQLLGEYLAGTRDRPIWGTGEIDYHDHEQKGSQIHDILTVFLVRERTRAAVLEALRQGRLYAVRGGDEQLQLRRFALDTELGSAVSGEEVASSGQAVVSVFLDKANGASESVEARLVRDGRVVARFDGVTPLEFQYLETGLRMGEKTYYRLLAASRTARVTSNPIFATGVGGAP
jgi:hypothetical protein